jgi:hypothetical protein
MNVYLSPRLLKKKNGGIDQIPSRISVCDAATFIVMDTLERVEIMSDLRKGVLTF